VSASRESVSPCLLRQACYCGKERRKKRKRNKKEKKVSESTARLKRKDALIYLGFEREFLFIVEDLDPLGEFERGHGANDTILLYHIVILLALLWSPNKDDFVAGWFEFEHRCCF
jgi:hypothetical protein